MRGLKPADKYKGSVMGGSHLLQMRGLKLVNHIKLLKLLPSHLLQMRGLKPNVHQGTYEFTEVASFTDAWIETL